METLPQEKPEEIDIDDVEELSKDEFLWRSFESYVTVKELSLRGTLEDNKEQEQPMDKTADRRRYEIQDRIELTGPMPTASLYQMCKNRDTKEYGWCLMQEGPLRITRLDTCFVLAVTAPPRATLRSGPIHCRSASGEAQIVFKTGERYDAWSKSNHLFIQNTTADDSKWNRELYSLRVHDVEHHEYFTKVVQEIIDDVHTLVPPTLVPLPPLELPLPPPLPGRRPVASYSCVGAIGNTYSEGIDT